MITVTLAPEETVEWLGENPSPATFPADQGKHPLLHQWQTSQSQAAIIINANDTGTGKTKAALLRILERVRERNGQLDSQVDNVLFIAPTNELLHQHARDIKEFVRENALPYRVLTMTRASLNEIRQRIEAQSSPLSSGQVLHAIMENPRRAQEKIPDATDTERTKRAAIFVVNPDIFYYALYLRYNAKARIPLFQDIIQLCNFIVIDELHYYSPKQLANFLFFMALSHHLGYLDGSTHRQFCLLTATPDENVLRYLQRLGVSIDQIDRTPAEYPRELTQPVSVLAPIILQIYSREEVAEANTTAASNGQFGGLFALVQRLRHQIEQYMAQGEDGAIISGSLEQILQSYRCLREYVNEDAMGRITGPQSATGREQARQRQLILATPTVDIGYNFEHSGKQRQNIDFLLYDARSGDECIQRLGRAGRVLGKPEQTHLSHVFVVVDSEFYQALLTYDGQAMPRAVLRKLAHDVLPKRNDLYAYVRSGAIYEAFLPIFRMQGMFASDQQSEIATFFDMIRTIFGGSEKLTQQKVSGFMYAFLAREKCYHSFYEEPGKKLAAIWQMLQKKSTDESWATALAERLRQQQTKQQWSSPAAIYEWIENDIARYMVDNARFSFREAFQSPLALIADPEHMHTDSATVLDDALRTLQLYHVAAFPTYAQWQQATGMDALADMIHAADTFLVFISLRPPGERLRLRFHWDASSLRRHEWEQQYAYRTTALCGLTIVADNASQGIPPAISDAMRDRFVPMLIVGEQSQSAIKIWEMRKRALIIPYFLDVTFADGERTQYICIPGTLGLMVLAEIPYWVTQRDRAQIGSDDPDDFIC